MSVGFFFPHPPSSRLSTETYTREFWNISRDGGVDEANSLVVREQPRDAVTEGGGRKRETGRSRELSEETGAGELVGRDGRGFEAGRRSSRSLGLIA
eukprot:525212-Hanusia_phi.AAC.1